MNNNRAVVNRARSVLKMEVRSVAALSRRLGVWNLAGGRINYKYRRNKELSVGTGLAKDACTYTTRYNARVRPVYLREKKELETAF